MENEKRFDALAQVAKVGVVALAGIEVAVVNARALELFGCRDQAEFVRSWRERRVADCFLGAGATGVSEGRIATLEAGTPAGRQLRAEAVPLGDDRALILLSDPAILDTLESDARLAARAEGLARVYRGMAHDLKGSVGGMAINLDLLRESLGRDEAEPVRARRREQRYLAAVGEEMSRLNRSLLGILGHVTPNASGHEGFDLRNPLEEVIALLEPQARRQRVRVTRELPSAPVRLVGHRDQLKKAFLNVSVSALESMPNGGDMGMEMAVLDNHVRVEVRDTGEEIPAEILEQVEAVDLSGRTGGRARLPVARALVQLHGGDMEIRSAEGRGSAVRVALPVVPRS